ncbi:MAG: 5'/3'-nucleotidase SurE [Bacillota bacterium]
MEQKHILITNDDGIYAEGIQRLSQVLYEDNSNFTLSICAPDRERSAVGHAITMHKPLRAEKINYLQYPELGGWAVNGTPSDCVKLAVEAILKDKPDMVISGINRGSNLGTDVLYSGTVSAALEGLIMNIPSIAISLTKRDSGAESFNLAAQLVCNLAKKIFEGGFPASPLININIPPDINNIKGVKVTRLGTRRYRNIFEERIDPRGMSYYWLAGELVDNEEDEEDSDTRAIRDGYISITPLQFKITDEELVPELQKLLGKDPLEDIR